MRRELAEIIAQVDDLDVWHLQETVNLCQSLNTSHWQHTHAPYADGDMEDQEYIESLADQNFRTAADVHYIWQLGLWRLQAIFEGLIEQDLLKEPNVRGLRRKLERLGQLGFTLSSDERRQLDEWAALRNALSHRPVYVVSLTQQLHVDDLTELAELYSKLIERWREERPRLIPSAEVAAFEGEEHGC